MPKNKVSKNKGNGWFNSVDRYVAFAAALVTIPSALVAIFIAFPIADAENSPKQQPLPEAVAERNPNSADIPNPHASAEEAPSPGTSSTPQETPTYPLQAQPQSPQQTEIVEFNNTSEGGDVDRQISGQSIDMRTDDRSVTIELGGNAAGNPICVNGSSCEANNDINNR